MALGETSDLALYDIDKDIDEIKNKLALKKTNKLKPMWLRVQESEFEATQRAQGIFNGHFSAKRRELVSLSST